MLPEILTLLQTKTCAVCFVNTQGSKGGGGGGGGDVQHASRTYLMQTKTCDFPFQVKTLFQARLYPGTTSVCYLTYEQLGPNG